MPDWDEMCRIDPVLLELEQLATALGRDKLYHYGSYEFLKRLMPSHVGHGAAKAELQGSDAWDIAMDHIAMRCAP